MADSENRIPAYANGTSGANQTSDNGFSALTNSTSGAKQSHEHGDPACTNSAAASNDCCDNTISACKNTYTGANQNSDSIPACVSGAKQSPENITLDYTYQHCHENTTPNCTTNTQQANSNTEPNNAHGCCCQSSKRPGLPPGPRGLPILGVSHRWKGPETNLGWAREYGPMYSVRMGPTQIVYLNTIDLVEEYMEGKGSTLLGRPEGPAAIAKGLLFGEGDKWRENRQAFVRAMWQPSFLHRYQQIIMEEVDCTISQLSQTVGRPVELRTILLPAISHRLVTVLLGESLDRNGEEMMTLTQQMTSLANDVDLTSIAMRVFLKIKRFRRCLQCTSGSPVPDMYLMSQKEQVLINGWIARRRVNLTQSGGQPDPNALLDLLLTSPEYVSNSEEEDKELIQSIMDLFNGGVATTLSVLDFAVLYLIHNQEVQQSIRAEIHNVQTQGHHPISWENRHHFPYTYATLIETLRLASVTSSSLPHTATEEVGVEGYVVPKGVVVVASIFSLHRDPEYYEEAEVFRPERHLSEDSRRVVKPRSFRPFGVGERVCLGQQMAEMELFLFLAKLCSIFQFRAEDPSHPPSFHTKMRVVRRLVPFKCVLEHWD